MTARQRDFGALLTAVHGGQLDVTAGGSGDNTEDDGEWVDCAGYESCVLLLGVEAALGATETATIDMNAQTASDASGTGAADFGDAATQLVLTGGSGGTTERGVVELQVNLHHSDFAGFIRGQFTVNMSAGATDTARATLLAVRGGASELPAA